MQDMDVNTLLQEVTNEIYQQLRGVFVFVCALFIDFWSS